MGALAVPIMVGAAVGGGSKLIQGKGLGGILKGAALGGALGGVTGGLGGATASGATSGTSAVGAAQGAGQGMGVGLLDTGVGTTVFPQSVLTSGQAGIPLSALENALPTGVNLPAGVGDALAANNIGAPSYFDQFSQYAKDYATPQNLLGVGQILAQPSPAPNFGGGGGGIKGGGAVQYQPMSNVSVSSRKRRMNPNG